MPDESAVYEVRHGWAVLNTGGALIAAAMGGFALMAGAMWPLRAVMGAACVVGLVFALCPPFSRGVALRVDDEGVLYGFPPPWRKEKSAFVPWAHITAVVLWEQRLPLGIRLSYVGLRRLPGLPAVPGTAGALAPGRVATLASAAGVSAELAGTSHQAFAWKADKAALRTAITRFAPHVQLIDTRDAPASR